MSRPSDKFGMVDPRKIGLIQVQDLHLVSFWATFWRSQSHIWRKSINANLELHLGVIS